MYVCIYIQTPAFAKPAETWARAPKGCCGLWPPQAVMQSHDVARQNVARPDVDPAGSTSKMCCLEI